MANLITILRTLLVFVVTGLLFIKTIPFYVTAFVLTILIIWMDGLDGYVARKFNESSKLGAVLDIIGDRVVENVYWVAFLALGWLPLWIPIVILSRGIITDGIRSVGLEKGYTAFGSSTMMESKIGKFLVTSNFSRGTYAVAKGFAFSLLIVAHSPVNYPYQSIVSILAYTATYISVFFCVARGLPVLIEAKRFFAEEN